MCARTSARRALVEPARRASSSSQLHRVNGVLEKRVATNLQRRLFYRWGSHALQQNTRVFRGFCETRAKTSTSATAKTGHPHSNVADALWNNIQIVTGIEVNSESYFPKLQEYCPSAESTRTIFPQLREIRLTIDRWWQSLFVLLYDWSKWRRNT